MLNTLLPRWYRGIDCIRLQINIAQGKPLGITQTDIAINGHAIECRINTEDPITFQPSPGTIQTYVPPGGLGVVDSHYAYSGYKVPHYYESTSGKVITHGKDRSEAIKRMRQGTE